MEAASSVACDDSVAALNALTDLGFQQCGELAKFLQVTSPPLRISISGTAHQPWRRSGHNSTGRLLIKCIHEKERVSESNLNNKAETLPRVCFVCYTNYVIHYRSRSFATQRLKICMARSKS